MIVRVVGSSRIVRTVAVVAATFVLLGSLTSCRNETQNRLRRSIQDFTNTRMYVTVYAYGGEVVFEGIVDGKITRSSSTNDGGEASTGSYVYWYDPEGRYHQTDLPYLVTTYDRGGPPTASNGGTP